MPPSSSEFTFGVSREKPTRAIARKLEAIAKRHRAYLVEATIPGTGYQRWFATRNWGDASNSATARAVADDIAKEVK